MNRKEKQDLLERVDYDLEKAKAIHEWLTESEAKETEGKKETSHDDYGISAYTDENGENWVRVHVHDEDFLVASRDYTCDGKVRFNWYEAMDAMNGIGMAMWTKKQMLIVLAYIDEINQVLREICGEELQGSYWSSSEYNQYIAWYVLFYSSALYPNGKYSTFNVVRPVAAFKKHKKQHHGTIERKTESPS